MRRFTAGMSAATKSAPLSMRPEMKATLRGLFGSTDLAPGWYRVLMHGVRADGSVSQFVAVKFWVLKPPARRR